MMTCYIIIVQVIIYYNVITVYVDKSQKDTNQITTKSYDNSIRSDPFLMFLHKNERIK